MPHLFSFFFFFFDKKQQNIFRISENVKVKHTTFLKQGPTWSLFKVILFYSSPSIWKTFVIKIFQIKFMLF